MSDVSSLLRAGEQAVATRNVDQARKRFAQVLELEEHPGALVHLSYLESHAGHYRKGHDYALRAFRTSGHDPALALRIINRLRNFNLTGAIRDYVARSPQLAGMSDPKMLHGVAAQLSYIGEQQWAIDFLDAALRRHPANPAVLLARAQINTFLGRFDDAEADLDACLMYAPEMGAAWWTLSRLRKQTPASNHVDELRRRLAAPSRPAAERAYFAYALHKELDDLGDIPGACEALTIASRARRSEIKYTEADTRRLFAALKAMPAGPAPQPRDDGFTPIFIVGMFRSGTTLLEQLMGGNPCMHNAGELGDIASSLRYATDYQCPTMLDEEMVRRAARADFTEVADSYIRGVRWRLGEGHTHLTDKLPANFQNIGFICRALPNARIVHMMRDPVETCFSNLREQFSGAAPYSYDQGELAAFYRAYEDLMAHWRQLYPGRILDVRYSELTTDTEQVMRRVAAHCGMEFLPAMVDSQSRAQSVATASAVQVRSPVTARAVPKWDPYREYLRPLIQRLGDAAAA